VLVIFPGKERDRSFGSYNGVISLSSMNKSKLLYPALETE